VRAPIPDRPPKSGNMKSEICHSKRSEDMS
jgi:hypothetical protein